MEKQDNKLIYNIGQPCLYLRNPQFIKTWIQKCANEKNFKHVNN